MKAGPLFVLLGILTLLIGCNKSSEADTSSPGVSASRQDSNVTGLSATSRNTNDANRLYANDTNNTANQAADNTGRNARDRSDATLTPGDQGSSDSDREITRQIRRALTDNDQLSTSAKNIKIITINGKVTLRGPVANDQELKTITDAVKNVAGSNAIDNQLEVKQTNQ